MKTRESGPVGEVCPRCGTVESTRWRIRQLENRIAALEAENATLIASANAFADLADRLNKRLMESRPTDRKI